jgi:hypothetical protein
MYAKKLKIMKKNKKPVQLRMIQLGMHLLQVILTRGRRLPGACPALAKKLKIMKKNKKPVQLRMIQLGMHLLQVILREPALARHLPKN